MEEIIIGAVAGLAFQCQPADRLPPFQLTVPDAQSFAAHFGDWTTLYRWSMPADLIEPPENYEVIVDRLPALLMLNWRVTNNSPVSLGIFDYDAAAGTARFALSYEIQPAARASSMTETQGECRVLTVEEEIPS
ncbi:MAG: hypothetical protein ACTS1X_07690 [Parasphingopyxis sp.]|uniref:hypothetical protein n=1 Tax=Parasphingopyxis sp. TaxID=1920299 RepID=UPI003F9FA603